MTSPSSRNVAKFDRDGRSFKGEASKQKNDETSKRLSMNNGQLVDGGI